ncbi:hypothetical protein H257_04156 [Aphanomyces astaci]|uniref:Uncharacterized protein n=1 Tax=Aphanomyces astaci TaxID=112090 RepID=W4GWM0_APHAT|nr:hypothetical protein H257_04156 [Aphanomyces astaci]ETV83429.1 hypothetical protein H257_04156 [Aphanomyces astaci]|eukprot:XP_009826859.1 hypothetical protein H257_04156 [Aphanomyces astaci]
MNNVCFAVEAQIQQQLPERFGIVLDDWSARGTSYCCIMASFCATTRPFNTLSLSKQLYSKTLDAITFVIGENCSVNQRMAGLLNDHKGLLDRIHCVMLRAYMDRCLYPATQ